MAKQNGHNKGPTIIVRRGGGGDAGHHGGAWKIAYADFVTAMMAFFLVMWLINATTEQRRRGIANFFNPMSNNGSASVQAPPNPVTPTQASGGAASSSTAARDPNSVGMSEDAKSRTGQTYANGTAPDAIVVARAAGGFGPDSGAVTGRKYAGSGQALQLRGTIAAPTPSFPDKSLGRNADAPPALPRIVPVGGDRAGNALAMGDADAAQMEQKALERDAEALKNVLKSDATVAEDAGHVAIAVVPAGLRVELSETDQHPMFDSGSAHLNDHAVKLIRAIAPFLTALPEKLSIYGYTDAALYRNARTSNWTLSSMRADSARDTLAQAGFPDQRLKEVSGLGDHDLAVPDDPGAPENRRVVLILHRDHLLPTADPQGAAVPATQPASVR